MKERIVKHIINNQTGLLEKSTYYILDASGNQLSVYEHEVQNQDVTYTLAERQIYGSSHVGTLKTTVDMYNATQSNLTNTTLGEKRYSLGDHRGNINAVISDIKIPVATGTTVDYFDVYIVNIADFSPFNVELDGRTIKNDFYRYSVQGQEGHDEILGEGNYINYKYRGYDPRVGRLDWAVDPLATEYPHYSPYQFSGNMVIHMIELEGLEAAEPKHKDYGALAEHVYSVNEETEIDSKVDGTDYVVKQIFLNNVTGLRSALYENKVDGSAVYATAGTDDFFGDISANVNQMDGFSIQHAQSSLIGVLLAKSYGNKLTYVGHSLGGGEAALNALLTGLEAVTFNAAALSDKTKEYYEITDASTSKITAYSINIDVLTVALGIIGMKADGNEVVLNYPHKVLSYTDYANKSQKMFKEEYPLLYFGTPNSIINQQIFSHYRSYLIEKAMNAHSISTVNEALNK